MFSESRQTQNQSHVILFCFFNALVPQAQIMTKTAVSLHFASKKYFNTYDLASFSSCPKHNVRGPYVISVSLQVLEFWLIFLDAYCNIMNHPPQLSLCFIAREPYKQ